jgi:hypothetical protein
MICEIVTVAYLCIEDIQVMAQAVSKLEMFDITA